MDEYQKYQKYHDILDIFSIFDIFKNIVIFSNLAVSSTKH